MSKLKDLTNQKFGQLIVLYRLKVEQNGYAFAAVVI